ncbi:MAG: WD40 repeat domain-containing protein [Anaerolineae bacterium]|nr:WD40 repeat domain-containing protein [Anaerolineae bacterium]
MEAAMLLCPSQSVIPVIVLSFMLFLNPITYAQESPVSGYIPISASNIDQLELIKSWEPDGKLLSPRMGVASKIATSANVALVENRAQGLWGILWLETQRLSEAYRFVTDQVINRTTISPDGLFAAVADYNNLEIWNVDQGKQFLRIESGNPNIEVSGIEFSPQSDRLLVVLSEYAGEGSEAGVYLYDLTSGDLIGKLEQPDAKLAVFSPDGKRVAAAGSDGTIFLWGIENDDLDLLRVPDENSPSYLGYVSSDLIAVSYSSESGLETYTEYWDVIHRKRLDLKISQRANIYLEEGIAQIQLDDLASFTLWDVIKDRELTTLSNVGVIVDINVAGNLVTTPGIRFFGLDTGKLMREISEPNLSAAYFSFDNRYAILSSGKGYIQLWGVSDPS